MTASGRTSGRVVEESGNDLADGAAGAVIGADSYAAASAARFGRRQLAEIHASLSDRDLAVLRSVAALHFVTTRQLERLHFHGLGLSPQWAARGARQTLARLHDLKLLDRLERRIGGVRAGSASFVYALSRAGSRLLHDHNRRRSREPSLAHLSHVLDVAELVVRLHERARTGGDIDLLDVETEPACWRSFIDSKGRQRTLKPDLRATLGAGSAELHWFVELDRGTEHRPALVRKIQAYLAAWEDEGEQTRVGVFPRVLWVVPDARRAEVVAQVCNSLSGVPVGMFEVATSDRAVTALTSYPAGAVAGTSS